MKRYAFSSLLEILEVSPSFIKRLEKAEIIIPVVEGNKTFYTEHHMRKLLLAKELKEMGINLAGIEVILDVSERMLTMRKEAGETLYRLLKLIHENTIKENKRRR
ncbi:MAG: MerR family transcriptional regulator [Candidatus Dadabacteria bacterium]|nr:MerR family transcriptional regulator [Candidatus Dadabacteria bacterium]